MVVNSVYPSQTLQNSSNVKSALQKDFIYLVITSPNSFDARACIRSTWVHKIITGIQPNSLVIFPIGMLGLSASIKNALEIENSRFGNLLFLNDLNDSYENLVYKVGKSLKWTTENYPSAKFIVKVDEDVFVNLELLEEVFSKSSNNSSAYPDFIAGQKNLIHDPVRQFGKWYVSKEDYPDVFYPNYTLGSLYLMPFQTAKKLADYYASDKKPFIWEDVYFTGLMRKQLKIPLLSSELFLGIAIKVLPFETKFVCHNFAFLSSKQDLQMFIGWQEKICSKEKKNISRTIFEIYL